MDTLAHGLWGGVGFYRHGTKRFAAAFVLGMSPDLLSFGLFHVSRPGWLRLRLAGDISGPPPLSILPEFVFHAILFCLSQQNKPLSLYPRYILLFELVI